MKKKILLLFVTVSIVQISPIISQDYIPMLDSTIYWDVAFNSMGHICNYSDNLPNRYYVKGDTVIQGISYKKMFAYPFKSIEEGSSCPPFNIDTVPYLTDIFMREDLATKKVYRYYTDTETEKLLYDYGVSIGDTVYKESFSFAYPTVIDTIYDVTTNDGITRKYFSFNGGTWDESWNFGYVEGIGGEQGPFEVPFPYLENGYFILCIKNENSNIITGRGCYDFVTSVNEVEKFNVEFYPNPVENILSINFNDLTGKKTIKMYNTTGKLVGTFFAEDENVKINTTQIESGFYIIDIITSNNKKLKFNVIIK